MEKWIAEERLQRLVEGQHGRVSWTQLTRFAPSDSMIAREIENGHLIAVLPRVYAVGHRSRNRRSDLWAALLYAGPGAMLSHGTAAHWRGLIDYPPTWIEVSTPRSVRSLANIKVWRRRDLERWSYSGLPVTSLAQTVLDLAATSELKLVRRALAVLDYRHSLDLEALQAIRRKGRPGSKRLGRALADHQPQLARTNSELEVDFLEFCELHKVPVPNFNVNLHGITVDAHWPAHDLVIELDGYDNHSSRSQLRRDKRNDLILRRHGLTVVRYDWALLHEHPDWVHQDLLRARR